MLGFVNLWEYSLYSSQRTGLGVVGGFEKRPPGTAAHALLLMKIKNPAPITPNPM
jgi:hypothetical protein